MTKVTPKAHARRTFGSGNTDKGAIADAEQLVKDAFRIFVHGTRLSPLACPGFRVQIAIRHFIGMFYQQAVAYGLNDNLKITLDLISHGLEQEIPDDLCAVWASLESGQSFEPWVKKEELA